MGLFARRARAAAPAPGWAAPYFSAEDYAAFAAEVTRALRRHGLRFSFADGMVHIEGEGEPRLGLGNIAQLCAQAERTDWPDLVEGHFEALLRAYAMRGDGVQRTFEEARPLLKLRLWGAADLEGIDTVGRPVADDLLGVVCLDLPDRIEAVTADDVERWPVSLDELWEIAVRNVRDDGDELEVEQLLLDDGTALVTAVSDGFFAATHALWADELAGGVVGDYGALVAVPSRHQVIVHAIVDLRAVEACHQMLRLSVALYEQGPGSISPSLYWWRDEELQCLPAGRADADDAIAFSPTPEFVELLERLAEED